MDDGPRRAEAATRQQGRLSVRVGCASVAGPRPRNEDYAGCLLPGASRQPWPLVAAAIADGVGGAKGGRVAAELAVRLYLDDVAGETRLLSPRRQGARSLEAINRWLHAVGAADPALASMACTFTALVLRGRTLSVLHVGDTRLYRLRDGLLTRLTADHVSDRPGLRHVLTRALGAADSARIDSAEELARPHDRYLLCSDGVHGVLPDARLRDELGRRGAPEDDARRLVGAALAARSGDNATALVLDLLDLPPANRADLEHAIASQPIRPVPAAGGTVDGYALERVLADGRYSRVFRATDTESGRPVIIKFPKPLPGAEPTLRQAFLREAWIASRVSSPYVAEVIEPPAERRQALYVVMPFYEGETLESRIARPPLPGLAAGLRIAVPLARAVAALHRAGIIHRDIKPDNVVLQEEGGLRLVDLGVARVPELEDFPAPDVPGTPSYMAPELLAGAPGDAASDLYALGVTIYRLFTGAYPYGEIEPFSRPRFGRPTPLSARRPDLPAWLDEALARAVAVSPADRQSDVVEFIFALEHGALVAAPTPPRRLPLYARDPLRFWQCAAALLAAGLLGLLGVTVAPH